MPSDVEIANAALLRIGEEAITSFTEAGKPALLANNTYEIHRDALLRADIWRFAIHRQSLAAMATAPDWEFDYQYQLPAAPYYCLRVLTVENASDYDWRVEGRRIVTDIGAPLPIKFIYRVTDPEQFDSLFVETFVAKLQWEWAEALTKDADLRRDLRQEYAEKRMESMGVNGGEGKTEPRPNGTWYEAALA